MDDVTYTRDGYQYSRHEWTLINDVCQGERAIKGKKDEYLPIPNPRDFTPENKLRYRNYIERAVFYNATGRTLQGLIGAVYRKAPVINVPVLLEYVAMDVDGSGVNITQQSQKVLSEVLKKGRTLLYVDYPETVEQTSLADQSTGMMRASIINVCAEDVINWRMEKVGAVRKLSLVVICEQIEIVEVNGFGIELTTQYRVLRLIDGVYNVEIYAKDDAGDMVAVKVYTPKNGSGSSWSEIPAVFVGAKNNDVEIDQAPLSDLARLNIAHYRNSADYEDSAFFSGQAQAWISGLSETWRDHLEKTGVYVGSRTPMLLPDGGSFGFAQANPNTLVKEAMDQKERQMVALGARLVQRGEAVKTATQAQADNEAQHSVLSLVVENVNDAYFSALKWVAQFMNYSGELSFALNSEFTQSQLDPQMLTSLIGAWQSGQLPSGDLWTQFRKTGLIDSQKTDDEIRGELDSEDIGFGLENETEIRN